MSDLATLARRHWRLLAGGALGAAGGAAYAHFIGCHTGTCAITSNVWTAAAFFGFTGSVIAAPGSAQDPPAPDAGPRPPPRGPERAAP